MLPCFGPCKTPFVNAVKGHGTTGLNDARTDEAKEADAVTSEAPREMAAVMIEALEAIPNLGGIGGILSGPALEMPFYPLAGDPGTIHWTSPGV